MADKTKDTVISLDPEDDGIESASKFCSLLCTSLRIFFIPAWLIIFVCAIAAVFFGMQAHTSALEKAAVTPVIRLSVSPDIQFQDPYWKLYSDLVVYNGKWTFLMANKTCSSMGYEVLTFYSLSQAQEFDRWVLETLLWNEPDKESLDFQLWTNGQLQSRSNPNTKYYTAPFDYLSRATLKSDGYPECYSIKGASVHDGKLDRWSFFTRYNIVLDYDKNNFRDVMVEYNKTKACWMETRSNNINPTLKYSFACQKLKPADDVLITTTTTTSTPSPITKPPSPDSPTTTSTTTVAPITTPPNSDETSSPFTSSMTMEYPHECTDKTVSLYARTYNANLNTSFTCGNKKIEINFAWYYRMEPLKQNNIWLQDKDKYKPSKKCTGDVSKVVKKMCNGKSECFLCPNHQEFGNDNWYNYNFVSFGWGCTTSLFGYKDWLRRWQLKVGFQCVNPIFKTPKPL